MRSRTRKAVGLRVLRRRVDVPPRPPPPNVGQLHALPERLPKFQVLHWAPCTGAPPSCLPAGAPFLRAALHVLAVRHDDQPSQAKFVRLAECGESRLKLHLVVRGGGGVSRGPLPRLTRMVEHHGPPPRTWVAEARAVNVRSCFVGHRIWLRCLFSSRRREEEPANGRCRVPAATGSGRVDLMQRR